MTSRRIEPGPGQESVWDYPRPPRLEKTNKRVRIEIDGLVLANAATPYRVLETSHPPVFYIDPADIAKEHLLDEEKRSFCEWKGQANYYGLSVGDKVIPSVGWYYPAPTRGYEEIKDFVAFYPSKVNAFVNDEEVKSQEGDFYGGWITADIVGPFKGARGTWGW